MSRQCCLKNKPVALEILPKRNPLKKTARACAKKTLCFDKTGELRTSLVFGRFFQCDSRQNFYSHDFLVLFSKKRTEEMAACGHQESDDRQSKSDV
jgi:hypothetical protein